MSTYLSQSNITIVAAIALVAIIWLLRNHLRYRHSRRFAIRATAINHRVGSKIESLEHELQACIAREQHNEPMRCFGGPNSPDKERINQLRGILESHNSR